jgi:hypothetical protein
MKNKFLSPKLLLLNYLLDDYQCHDIIVVVVGYRSAPETRNPGAFEDGSKVLNWLAKQSNLAACGIVDAQSHIFYSFDASMVKPWLAAHGDPSRYPFGLTCLFCSSSI